MKRESALPITMYWHFTKRIKQQQLKVITMKIKIKEISKGLYTEAKDEQGNIMPFINPKGDCIDLRAAEDHVFNAPVADTLRQKDGIKSRDVKYDTQMIGLGIAMQLPEGFSAVVRPRSSTVKKLKIVMATSGYIDTSYNGDNDEWKFYCYAIDRTKINRGDRICQFMIIPNQFATVWQKLKWLFSNKVTFEWVESLGNEDRGGHGSTGIK